MAFDQAEHFTRTPQSAKQTVPALLSEARHVPATALQRRVFAPSSSRLCLCFAQGILLSLLRNADTHTQASVRTYTHPHQTGRQITPRPGSPNIPLHKEALGTLLCSSQTCSGWTRGVGKQGGGTHFSTATFLTKSEMCRESLLPLPREKLSITEEKRSQRKEKKKGENSPSLSRPRSPRPAGFLSLLCTFPK